MTVPDDATLFGALVKLAASLPATEVIQTPDGPMTEAEVLERLHSAEFRFEAARDES